MVLPQSYLGVRVRAKLIDEPGDSVDGWGDSPDGVSPRTEGSRLIGPDFIGVDGR